MKKIVIVDGGPRKNMNTAQLLQRFSEGAKSVGEDVEVKIVRLYDIDYKGCTSCMACKLKGQVSDITYVGARNKHAYLALVTDAYSKTIVGYDSRTHSRQREL